MADIWGRTITLGSTISGERVRVTFSSNLGLLAMQARIQATRRQVGQMMDLSTGKLHIIAGLPDPCQVNLTGVVVSSATYKTFIETFGDACSGQSLQITVTPGYCTTTAGGNLVYTIDNAILATLDNSVGGEQYMFIGSLVLTGIGPTITTS